MKKTRNAFGHDFNGNWFFIFLNYHFGRDFNGNYIQDRINELDYCFAYVTQWLCYEMKWAARGEFRSARISNYCRHNMSHSRFTGQSILFLHCGLGISKRISFYKNHFDLHWFPEQMVFSKEKKQKHSFHWNPDQMIIQKNKKTVSIEIPTKW